VRHLKCHELLSLKVCVESQICSDKKFYDFEGDGIIRWYHWFDLGWRFCQGQGKVTINFFNGMPHFSLHIQVTYLKSFSKHYNGIFFRYFSNYKTLKATVSPALTLLKMSNRLKFLQCTLLFRVLRIIFIKIKAIESSSYFYFYVKMNF